MTPEMETASTALQQLLSDVTMATNSSSDVTNATTPVECADKIPMTGEFLARLSVGGYVLLGFLFLFTAMTVGIYIEEITFILRTFKIDMRKKKTIWILAFFPVYAVCGCLAVIVPRSGPLVDMVANSFFGTCLYNFGRLMMNYMGGGDRIWDIVGHDRYIAMNTPPCCCCCVCIPPQHLNRSLLMRITMQILQVAIVRPVIMFFAAILWTNESYYPGSMNLNNGFIYITIVNLTSTLVAVYGLLLMRGAFRQELEKDFVITGKILSIQLTLLSSAIPNLIIGILVATDVIPCAALFPSKARGEVIYHAVLVCLMLPFSLLGRHFFRRSCDGSQFVQGAVVEAGPDSALLASAAQEHSTNANNNAVESQKGFA